MTQENSQIAIAEEIIISKIYNVRGKQVMLSYDLAELYQVETRMLNQQVKRNIGRSPDYSDAIMLRMYYVAIEKLKPNTKVNIL